MPNDLPPWHAVDDQTRRWVVERSFARAARCRLVKDRERLPETVAGLHVVAFACLMLRRVAPADSP